MREKQNKALRHWRRSDVTDDIDLANATILL